MKFRISSACGWKHFLAKDFKSVVTNQLSFFGWIDNIFQILI